MHILVDVAAERLRAELIELLERAGHTIERGAPTPSKRFDVVMVGTPEIAARLRRERPYDAIHRDQQARRRAHADPRARGRRRRRVRCGLSTVADDGAHRRRRAAALGLDVADPL